MSDALLEARGLTKRFGGVLAVDGVSLSVQPAEIFGVVGPNGAGKTTLLNIIAGQHPPDQGEVWMGGRRLNGLSADAVARLGMIRTFQQPRLFRSMTVLENCMLGAFRDTHSGLLAALLGLRSSRADSRRARGLADSALQRVGLGHLAEQPADVLTTGQQRLVEVSRVLASEARVWLLDEPAAGLDGSEVLNLAGVISSMRSRHRGIVLIEHDMSLVMSICDRVLVMDGGRPVTTGMPAVVRSDPRVVACYLGKNAANV